MANEVGQRWREAIERLLKQALVARWYGQICIEVMDGRIVRVTFERSYKDPDDVG